MFDVVWANPDRELVGQHKARKERERERRQQHLQSRPNPLLEDSASSGRSAVSLHSDHSSSTKPRSFLDAIRLKRKTSARHDASSLASGSRISSVFSDATDTRDARGCRASGPDDDNRRGSLLSPPPSVSSSLEQASSGRHPYFLGDRSFQHTPHFSESLQSSQDRSSQDDSILSRWTISTSLATVLSLDEAEKNDSGDTIQGQRESGTEERSRPRMRPFDAERCRALTADGEVPGIGQVPPLTPVASSPHKISSPVTPTSPLVFRQTSARKAASSLHSGTTVSDLELTSHPAFCPPLGRSMSAHSVAAPCTLSGPSSNQSVNVVGAGPPERLARTPDPPRLAVHDPAYGSFPLVLSRAQRAILQMDAASPETFWERLTEEWRPCANAAQYRKIEMDRKRWLLAALYRISPVPGSGGSGSSPGTDPRVLAFFESRATTSFISARHAGAPVHHMAPRPLASPLFPNVIPVPAASVPCLALPAVGPAFVPLSSSMLPQPTLCPLPPLPPLPPSPAQRDGGAAAAPAAAPVHVLFSDIYAQALPVLVSSSDIPLVLRNLHRLLRPQGAGVLHLVLIDAAPGPSGFCARTTGPRMLAWLDKHLLLNLERQFRCTRPTTLFPTWLRDAHFQVAGSCQGDGGGGDGAGDGGGGSGGGGGNGDGNGNSDGRVVCRFRAVVGEDGEENGTGTDAPKETLETTTTTTDASNQKAREQQRLHSLVGQKLWQEVWGRYVTADRWWWEDEACREECLRLRTTWEYHLVDAVKKERYTGLP